jgi:hypothetical protein
MTEEEKQIIPQVILNDLKYLSVRQLYFNWFFPTGAEVANQLIDNTIKVYLQSIKRQDIINRIRKLRGNETHNVVRMINMLIAELSLDFDLATHEEVLDNLYKLYQNRYLDSIQKTGACKTLIGDLNTIDYTYEYFRNKIDISEKAKGETIINKLFAKNQDFPWGIDNISLMSLFCRNNKHFKIN